MDKIKYCPNCGNQLTPGSKFCEHCGQSLAAVRGEKTVDSLTQWHRTHDFKRMMQVFLVSLVVLLILSWQNIAAFFSPTTSISLNSEGFGNVLIEFALGILVYMIVFSIAVLLQVGRKKATHAWVRWLGSFALGVLVWLAVFSSLWVSWSLCNVMLPDLDETGVIPAIACDLIIIITVIVAVIMTRFLFGKVREKTITIILVTVIIATLIPMIIEFVMAMLEKQVRGIIPLIVVILFSLLWLLFIKKLVNEQNCIQLLHLGKVLVLPFTLAMVTTLAISTSHYNLRYNYQVTINRQKKIMYKARKVKKAFTKCLVMVNGDGTQFYTSTHFRYDPSWNPGQDSIHQMISFSDSRYKKDAKSGEVYFDVYDNGRNDDSADSGKKAYDETGGYYFIGKKSDPLTVKLQLTRSGNLMIIVYPAYSQHCYRSYGGKMYLIKYEGMQSLKGKLPSEDGHKLINVEFIGAE